MHAFILILAICGTIANAVVLFGGLTNIQYLRELHMRFATTLRQLLRIKPAAKILIPAFNLFFVVLFMHFGWLDVAAFVVVSALLVEVAMWRVQKIYFDVR